MIHRKHLPLIMFRCTINTQKPFHVSHFQTKQIANVYMSQEGREVNFNICDDSGYNEQFWYSYPGMAVAGGMWGKLSHITDIQEMELFFKLI